MMYLYFSMYITMFGNILKHIYKLGLQATTRYQWWWNDKKKQGFTFETLFFPDIYKIQIVQNIAQLSSKGSLINHPCF
jgi:hypothetical protein